MKNHGFKNRNQIRSSTKSRFLEVETGIFPNFLLLGPEEQNAETRFQEKETGFPIERKS
jgi:hypothetical protein